MSAADLVMDSEKEETVTSIQHVEIQQEEVVPGSSPEGVFPNEDGQMFEDIQHSNGIAPHQLPLHVEELKHGEEIVEERNKMLHQSDQLGELIEEENEQQYMHSMNIKEETPDEPMMEETKPIITESIAPGVAQSRRTSAKLSKSEDDADSQALSIPTTRGAKERRTSEPIRGALHGIGSGIDIDVTVTHCGCQEMFDALKFYVQCDLCTRWYHGECDYTCDKCIEEQERVKEEPALHCLCKKPYDDTKFYAVCNSCQGWFHPECVGTTRELAEAIEYNCPECRREDDSDASDGSVNSRASSCVKLNRADYVHVIKISNMLLAHWLSTPFRNPVDLKVFPDYLQTIKKPMDLSTIAQKVDRAEYSYLREFVNDVHLVFENAKRYNPRTNAVFKCAERIQEYFENKLIDVWQTIRARHEQIVVDQQGGPSMTSSRKGAETKRQRIPGPLELVAEAARISRDLRSFQEKLTKLPRPVSQKAQNQLHEASLLLLNISAEITEKNGPTRRDWSFTREMH